MVFIGMDALEKDWNCKRDLLKGPLREIKMNEKWYHFRKIMDEIGRKSGNMFFLGLKEVTSIH